VSKRSQRYCKEIAWCDHLHHFHRSLTLQPDPLPSQTTTAAAAPMVVNGMISITDPRALREHLDRIIAGLLPYPPLCLFLFIFTSWMRREFNHCTLTIAAFCRETPDAKANTGLTLQLRYFDGLKCETSLVYPPLAAIIHHFLFLRLRIQRHAEQ
jgi:hypothetical protein